MDDINCAHEAALTMKKTENPLIKNGPTEELLKKVNKFKTESIAARARRQEEEMKELKRRTLERREKIFVDDFCKLCWNFLMMSRNQMKCLTKEELIILMNQIGRMAKTRAICQKILCAIPVIGQIAWLILFHEPLVEREYRDKPRGGEGFVSWRYASYLKKSKAVNGENIILSKNGWELMR